MVYPPGTRTGVKEVDDVITAALTGDIAAMRQLVRYTITGCTKSPGLGGPPKCEYGEVEGTRVEVFPILGPEGGFVRRPSVDSVLQFKVKGLYGVYRVPANAYEADYWPSGKYGIVLIRDEGPALTLLVEDGGMVRIVHHMLPLEMALKQDVGEWLLPPPTASPMSNADAITTPAAQPDLVISHIYLEMEGRHGSCVSAYTPYGIRVVIQNRGSVHASSFLADLNGTRQTVSAGLAAGQAIELHFAGTTPGGQYVATVDVTNQVAESDETNNTRSYQAPTPTPPPLCTPTQIPSIITPTLILTRKP